VNSWFRRWDERNQRVLEEHNRWLSGDDWVERSAELQRLHRIREATAHTIRFAAMASLLVGAKIAWAVGDWRWGLVVAVPTGLIVWWLWRSGGRFRERYGHQADRIERGP
jgi:hypothetical protein